MKNNTPIEFARQALTQLSNDKIPPTPENYRRVYDRIAGIESVDHSVILNKSLIKILNEMGREYPKFATAAESFHKLFEKSDPIELEELLRSLLTKGGEDAGVNWNTLLRSLLKQLETNHGSFSLHQKIEKLNDTLIKFTNDHNQLGMKIHVLITSWEKGQVNHQTAAINYINEKAKIQEQAAIQAIVLSSGSGVSD